ncbi:hypothetical protein HanIR_Chr17g0865071 [Helianthus annuus]|nr:hypothetical protein HanIR_Chr17g0865071 [Helianthus annuus]
MNNKNNISGLLFYTCFKLLSSIFSKEISRQRKRREKRDAKESRERECSGAGESPATGPTRACLPPTETKSSSLRFPARVPIKFWQFPVSLFILHVGYLVRSVVHEP